MTVVIILTILMQFFLVSECMVSDISEIMSIQKVLNYTSTNLHGHERNNISLFSFHAAFCRHNRKTTIANNGNKFQNNKNFLFLHPINTYIKFTQMAS